MQQINLYQEQFKPQRHIPWMGVVCAALVLVLLLMAAVAWQQKQSVQRVQQRLHRVQTTNNQLTVTLEEVQKKLEKRQPSVLLQQQLSKLRTQLKQRQPLRGVLERLLAQKSNIPTALTALAAQPLHKLWLTKIDLAAGGNVVRLQGLTTNGENVPVFVDQLAKQQVFSRRNFAGLQVTKQKNGLYEFVLSTTLEAGQ